MSKKRNTHIFDLYWEDILVAKVLPYLTIRECFNFRCVSRTCLQIINMYFAKLKSLKLMNKGFSPHTFSVFATNCTRLSLLNLSRCTSITDDDLIPMLCRNHDLVCLNLSQCKNLSAKCLQPVILHCNNLRILKLARCFWLTTGALEALALHQSKLEDVDLAYCLSLSENCILIFLKKFRELKTLNLEGNKQVTDKCLYTISKYSTSLRHLNLGGCCEVTDKGIRVYFQNGPTYFYEIQTKIHCADVYKCVFKALAVHCTNLEGLLVRGCTKVTENSLRLMRNNSIYLDRRPADPVPLPIYVQI